MMHHDIGKNIEKIVFWALSNGAIRILLWCSGAEIYRFLYCIPKESYCSANFAFQWRNFPPEWEFPLHNNWVFISIPTSVDSKKANGQGQWSKRYTGHLGKSSELKSSNTLKKYNGDQLTDGLTNQRTNGQTKRDVESHSLRLKRICKSLFH